jgi:hypothetical protein
MSEFENLWNFLQRKLKPGIEIPNWTAYGGYLGDSMTITDIHHNSIEVKAPKARNVQHVPKKDFENVWRIWSDYKIQKVKRYELRDMTRFSKYVISILKWYEEEVKK